MTDETVAPTEGRAPAGAEGLDTTNAHQVYKTSEESKALLQVRAAARDYIGRGWPPVEIPHRQKGPTRRGWLKEPVTAETVDRYFDGIFTNVGVLLGKPAGGLVDVDLDHPVAVAVAQRIIAARTGAKFGRKSRGTSHLLFECPGIKSQKFTVGGEIGVLIEIRSTGDQTVFPPSVHTSGELVEWHGQDAPRKIAADDLERLVSISAALAFIAIKWPPRGTWRLTGLALRGALARAGHEAKDIRAAVHIVADAARALTRGKQIEETIARIKEGKPTTGFKRLTELLNLSKEEATLLRRWLYPGDPGENSIIINGRHMRDLTADAMAALLRRNGDQPMIFRFGGEIARVERGIAKPLDAAGVRHELSHGADWIYAASKTKFIPTDPPDKTARDLLAMPASSCPLPELTSIARAPIFAPDGTIHSDSGYDDRTKAYLVLDPDLKIPTVTDNPSPDDVARARGLIEELLFNFPFADDASRAHAVAALLQPHCRLLIAGPTPLYLYTKPSIGTGASLLVDATTLVSRGEPLPPLPPAADEDEMRKRLLSTLKEGPSHFFIDNAEMIASSSLSAAITSAGYYRDRVLGQSKIVEVPTTCTWMATGNNVTLSDEMTRRIAPVCLDARMEKPWERTGFKHNPLLAWVREHRGELIWACLTLIQAWIVGGKKPGTAGAVLGSFEAWRAVMGGIFARAGINGFLGNVRQQFTRASAEAAQWKKLIQALWDDGKGSGFKASDAMATIDANELDIPIKGDGDKARLKSLGWRLKKKAGLRWTLADGTSVTLTTDDGGKSNEWTLTAEVVDDPPY